MKHLGKLAIAMIFVVVLCGAASIASKAAPVIDDSKKPSYLFSMSAASGSFDQGELTLNGVPLVVYFTDRPYRKAGHLSLEEFAKLWKKDAKKQADNPPNAELAIYDQDGATQAVAILSQPKVGKNEISYTVKIIGGNISKTFGHATLFVDTLLSPHFIGGID